MDVVGERRANPADSRDTKDLDRGMVEIKEKSFN